MLSPDIAPVPQAKPFLAAAAQFASRHDTPRAYLERCLDALATWEPKIGAFVHTNLDGARAAADASSRRWRDNKPLSAIDGMPVGIKDIIETADMPTEMGSPLFDGWSLRARRCGGSGFARSGSGHSRKDSDDRVRGDRAARHPQSLGSCSHSGRIQQRFGCRRCSRSCQRCARHAGDGVDRPAGQLLRLRGVQAECRRHKPGWQPR